MAAINEMVGVQIAPLDEKEIFENFNDTDVGGKGSRHRFSIVAGSTWPGLTAGWGVCRTSCFRGPQPTVVSSTIKAVLRTAMLRFLTQILTIKMASPSKLTRFGNSSI